MLAATGACRGHRDPATPLHGAFAQYATNFVLDIALIFGIGMGIEGAAAAATIGQYVGLAVVLRGLLSQGDLAVQDVGRIPNAQDAMPYVTVQTGVVWYPLESCDAGKTHLPTPLHPTGWHAAVQLQR